MHGHTYIKDVGIITLYNGQLRVPAASHPKKERAVPVRKVDICLHVGSGIRREDKKSLWFSITWPLAALTDLSRLSCNFFLIN